MRPSLETSTNLINVWYTALKKKSFSFSYLSSIVLYRSPRMGERMRHTLVCDLGIRAEPEWCQETWASCREGWQLCSAQRWCPNRCSAPSVSSRALCTALKSNMLLWVVRAGPCKWAVRPLNCTSLCGLRAGDVNQLTLNSIRIVRLTVPAEPTPQAPSTPWILFSPDFALFCDFWC